MVMAGGAAVVIPSILRSSDDALWSTTPSVRSAIPALDRSPFLAILVVGRWGALRMSHISSLVPLSEYH